MIFDEYNIKEINIHFDPSFFMIKILKSKKHFT